MIPALAVRLELDALDEHGADYVGPNGAGATVDRATWESQGRPVQVTVIVGDFDPQFDPNQEGTPSP